MQNQTQPIQPTQPTLLRFNPESFMLQFMSMASQLQQSLFEEAQDKFSTKTSKALESMAPKYARTDGSTRCLMPFHRGKCKRPRNPMDPDALCKQCRTKNNSLCKRNLESYFNFWDPNDEPVPLPTLKVRGIQKRAGRPRKVPTHPPVHPPPSSSPTRASPPPSPSPTEASPQPSPLSTVSSQLQHGLSLDDAEYQSMDENEDLDVVS